MAKLNAKKRAKIPSSEFGLPKSRKYPMPDKSHAQDAKARASEERAKGNLTKGQEQKIDRKADRKLKRKK